MSTTGLIERLAATNLFDRSSKTGEILTGDFVGRPFHLDYDRSL